MAQKTIKIKLFEIQNSNKRILPVLLELLFSDSLIFSIRISLPTSFTFSRIFLSNSRAFSRILFSKSLAFSGRYLKLIICLLFHFFFFFYIKELNVNIFRNKSVVTTTDFGVVINFIFEMLIELTIKKNLIKSKKENKKLLFYCFLLFCFCHFNIEFPLKFSLIFLKKENKKLFKRILVLKFFQELLNNLICLYCIWQTKLNIRF